MASMLKYGKSHLKNVPPMLIDIGFEGLKYSEKLEIPKKGAKITKKFKNMPTRIIDHLTLTSNLNIIFRA
jgi:hypothetical protein